jgi:shikimate 5-dehydrogenase
LPRDFRAVIVGYGGSARAAFIALKSLGCKLIFVTGRNAERLRNFTRTLGGTTLPFAALRQERFDLLIHATPVGMWPHGDESLLSQDQLHSGVVFDLVYNPPETRLLQVAQDCGCKTISGLEMFLAQAARQFEYWTAGEAPAKLMRRMAIGELERLRARSMQGSPS